MIGESGVIMSLNTDYEEISRGDGNVTVRVFENCVQVFWTNESNLGDTARKTIKDEILNEFKGKLIVDFKREGQCLVMCDVITILSDDLDFEEFKGNIIEHHTRCREKTAEWKSENQVHLFSASKGINCHVSFYGKNRKVMAQGRQEQLRTFMSYYGAVVNHMFGQNQITASELATIPVWNMTSQEVDKFEVQGMMSDSVDPPIDGAAPFLEETVRLNQISEEVGVHDTNVKSSVFSEHQKSLMKELHELKETTKNILQKMPQISEITQRFDKFEAKYKVDIADINARLLNIEEAAKNTKSDVAQAFENVRMVKKNTVGVGCDVSRALDDISNVRAEFSSLPGDIKVLADKLESIHSNTRSNPVKAPVANRASNTACADESLLSTIPSTQSAVTVDRPHAAVAKPPIALVTTDIQPANPENNTPVPRDAKVFRSKILAFMDSNGKHLKVDILKHDMSAEKIWAPTIEVATNIIEDATFEIEPSLVLIHTVTNDAERLSPAEVYDRMKYLIELTRARLPNTMVWLSGCMPRRDLQENIGEINSWLAQLARESGAGFINHASNMNTDMLIDEDKKHVNKKGFFTMLANIRFAMFNILPKVRYRKSYQK